MTKTQHAWDVLIRSIKTVFEAYGAFLLAGGFGLFNQFNVHISTAFEVKVSLYAGLVAAVVNIIIKLHNAITGSSDVPVTVPDTTVPTL